MDEAVQSNKGRTGLSNRADQNKCIRGHDISEGSPDRVMRSYKVRSGDLRECVGCKSCERENARKTYEKKKARMQSAEGKDILMGTVQFDQRSFETMTVTEGAQSRRAYVVTCRQCGVKQKMTANNASNTLPPEAIFNKFDRMGWRVEKNSSTHDLCPTCIRNTQIERKNKQTIRGLGELDKIFKPATTNGHIEEPSGPLVRAAAREQGIEVPAIAQTASPPLPEAPVPAVNQVAALPAMGREDRRIIFAKLNEVHQGEARGYKSGWSDTKVATDLGTPIGWVSMVRDEYFGQEGLSEENQRLVDESKVLADKISSLEARFADTEANFAQFLEECDRRHASFQITFERLKTEVEAMSADRKRLVAGLAKLK